MKREEGLVVSRSAVFTKKRDREKKEQEGKRSNSASFDFSERGKREKRGIGWGRGGEKTEPVSIGFVERRLGEKEESLLRGARKRAQMSARYRPFGETEHGRRGEESFLICCVCRLYLTERKEKRGKKGGGEVVQWGADVRWGSRGGKENRRTEKRKKEGLCNSPSCIT